jgi:hypothetical protein
MLKNLKLRRLLQHVLVYINHHQGARSLFFAKVTVLISIIQVVIEIFGIMAAYVVHWHRAQNFKEDMALQDNVFLFSCWRALNS